ncbi:MAG: hypothetical protein KC420_02990 [Myxococcales bacterium]|nr:hypothetical protein [Myxococcales bacterium]
MQTNQAENHNDETYLDDLIKCYRGEQAAILAYDEAIRKYRAQPEEPTLVELRREHVDAARRLKAAIHDHDEPTPAGAGAWGVVVAATERAAAMISDEAPLRVLRHGESMGRDRYAALLDDEPSALSDALYVELAGLRARCGRHVRALGRLIERVPQRPPRPMIGRRLPRSEVLS